MAAPQTSILATAGRRPSSLEAVTLTNPLDAFLDPFRTKPSSEDLRQAVNNCMTASPPPNWLIDLIELKRSDESKRRPDDVESVCEFLHSYYIERPWDITEGRIQELRELDNNLTPDAKTPMAGELHFEQEARRGSVRPEQRLGIPLPGETLQEFIARQTKACAELPGGKVLVPELLFNESATTDQAKRLVDDLLGVAGFRPDISLLNSSSSRAEVLQEMRDHIKVTDDSIGHHLGVSLGCGMRSSLSSEVHDDMLLDSVMRVVSLYRRLDLTVKGLEKLGRFNKEFSYISRKVSETRTAFLTFGDGDRNQHHGLLETKTISRDQINLLLQSLETFKDAFTSHDQPESMFKLRLWRWTWLLHVEFPALIFAKFLFHAVSFFWGWSSSSASVRSDTISKLMDDISPILAYLPIMDTDNGRYESENQQMVQKLHRIALIGQMLCLVLQASVRGMKCPIELDGWIDRPISRFSLKGVDDDGPVLFASSQPLPCFDEQEFLVFDPHDNGGDAATELHTTVAAVLNLFHPVQILVQKQGHESRQELSCIAMNTEHGLICQDHDVNCAGGLIRWQFQNTGDVSVPSPTQTNEKFAEAIDLHDEICLGRSVCPSEEISTHDNPSYSSVSQVDLPLYSSDMAQNLHVQPNPEPSLNQQSVQGPSLEREDEGSPPSGSGNASVRSMHKSDCPGESNETERFIFEQLKEALLTPGEDAGGWTIDGAQLQAGFQPPSASLNAMLQFARRKGTTHRKSLQHLSDCHNELERSTCVQLSLHTGVLQRVKLREVVAFLIERFNVVQELSPTQRDDLVRLLRSSTPLKDWMRDTEETEDGRQLRRLLDSITLNVFSKLGSWTGVLNRKALCLLWPVYPEQCFRISRQHSVWIEALKDTRQTTTFACVVSKCQETPECRCKMARRQVEGPAHGDWKNPDTFRLETTVGGYREYVHGQSTPLILKEGRSYWLSNPGLGVLVKVIGIAETDGQPRYYLSARSSAVPRWIYKHFRSLTTIREMPKNDSSEGDLSPSPKLCVLGSGAAFERLFRLWPYLLTSQTDPSIEA